jgi:magnesium transporter
MKIPLLVPELHEMIENGQHDALRDFCEDGNPAVVAELLSPLGLSNVRFVLIICSPSLQAKIFSFLEYNLQVGLLSILKRRELSRILTNMPPDDRADLFKRMPEEMSENLMPALAHAEREDIRKLSSYPEGTAGSVMTSDYATLEAGYTATQAILHLRNVAPDKETIYLSYVVTRHRKLLGSVSLQDLLVARKDETVGEIMQENTIFVRTSDDQEEAANKIQKYDLLAIPVMNEEDILVGIITHDDAIDILTQEHTEDLEKIMAITGRHETAAYMKTTVWKHFSNRAVWVTILAILSLLSGMIVEKYENLILQVGMLAVFMPMLADAGGNTGSQSATLVIRALALKEITPKDAFRVLAKEARIALLLGILLGCLVFARVIIFGQGSEEAPLILIGLSISIALSLQVVTATVLGAILPLVAARFRLDPAVIASPAISTIVDITGLFLYFTTASIILGL